MTNYLDQIICGDCLEVMRGLPDGCVDLTVTSPPYDDLRTYNGYVFDFEGIAKELYRVTKDGGVVVWVVNDATIKGSETGTSFRQALYFKDVCGFNLHDTMIYQKNSYPFPPLNRYYQQFEYMFIFSKKPPKTHNLLRVKTTWKKATSEISTTRLADGTTQKMRYKKGQSTRIRDNVWVIDTGYMRTTKCKEAYKHPAMFPEQLANDHIISWSNPGDVVLDPFCGSGTTCKMAKVNGRHYVGIDISEEYCEIARRRVAEATPSLFKEVGV